MLERHQEARVMLILISKFNAMETGGFAPTPSINVSKHTS
jgi:hypothetical protein